ncbi:MAG: lysine--tRNA ligase [Candidatus Eisenbacteria bacterium]|nr:lysine--tRNA ligase [Candidatus Eisenbacteria bacterium]
MRHHLEELREAGVDPYPRRFARTHFTGEIVDAFDELEGERVTVAGRLMSIRSHGKAGFADIADAGGKVQLFVRQNDVGDEAFAVWKLLDVGDHVGAEGEVMKTRTGEISVRVKSVVVLSKALRPLPEKWHGIKDVEVRSRRRYLDLIANPESRRVFLARSAVVRSIRDFLDERGFLEVETPILQPIYGGAFASPFVTHHHALDADLYLRIADELYLKRLIVGGLERVFEIGKDFRNEGMDRTHSPEFTQLELYQAYADYEDMMELTEAMIVAAATEATGGTTVSWQGTEIDLSPPWRRLTVDDALRGALGVGADAPADDLRSALRKAGVEMPEDADRAGLIEEALSELVEPNLVQPTFLMDYPKEISPLAKEKPETPGIVERFEPFIAGIEIGNSFTELNDPVEQRARLELQEKQRAGGDAEAQGIDEDFLMALEHGMPPTGGLGIGVDRLVMLLTDSAHIRDVILFPAMRHEAGD